MDLSLRQELLSLVEELTHSGAPVLSEEPLKRVKKICRCANKNARRRGMLIKRACLI